MAFFVPKAYIFFGGDLKTSKSMSQFPPKKVSQLENRAFSSRPTSFSQMKKKKSRFVCVHFVFRLLCKCTQHTRSHSIGKASVFPCTYFFFKKERGENQFCGGATPQLFFLSLYFSVCNLYLRRGECNNATKLV